jgi:hypothetical protein
MKGRTVAMLAAATLVGALGAELIVAHADAPSLPAHYRSAQHNGSAGLEQARAVAVRFTVAAVRPASAGPGGWTALATPPLAARLARIGPPTTAGKLSGLSIAVHPQQPGRAVVLVDATLAPAGGGQPIGLALRLVLLRTPAGWRVAAVGR